MRERLAMESAMNVVAVRSVRHCTVTHSLDLTGDSHTRKGIRGGEAQQVARGFAEGAVAAWEMEPCGASACALLAPSVKQITETDYAGGLSWDQGQVVANSGHCFAKIGVSHVLCV